MGNNAFTEEVNKIASSANDDKEIQSIDSTATYVYETSKDLVCKKEKTNAIIKQSKKMNNFDDFIKENRKKHNKNLPQIPNHPYKMQIIRGSASRKTFII